MAIVAADLILFSSASMPTDDTSTSGGAVSTTSRPELTQFGAAARLALISDGADVRTATAVGRSTAGVIVTEVVTLTGAVEVLSVATFERMHSVTLSATSGTRTVLVKEGTGGTTRATIGLNETTRIILFRDSSSAAGITIRFEKSFFKNAHATLTLTGAAVKLTADPAARMRIGVVAAKGDSTSVATRLTVPSGPTFVDDNVSQGVPTGTLAAAETIGVWVEENLPANDPPQKNSLTLELSGSST